MIPPRPPLTRRTGGAQKVSAKAKVKLCDVECTHLKIELGLFGVFSRRGEKL